MTSRVAVRPVAGRGRPPAGRRPFSIVDELNCYLDSAAEPNNVHLEVWLPGPLSPDGLRAAATAALAGSPQARARRAAGAWWRSRYAWECPPEADVDPVSVVFWQDQAELDAARAQFLADAPPLDRSPLFRLLLARGPGRDSLILNAHHAAFDGRSCLSLLSLIAEHYGGPPPPPSAADRANGARSLPWPSATLEPVPPAWLEPVSRAWLEPMPAAARQEPVPTARQEPVTPAPQEPVPRARPLPAARGPARKRPPASRLPLQRTARIASQHAHGPLPLRRAGHGVSLLGWPDVPAAPQPGVTVNDLLIAALIQAVAGWNTGRRRWSGRVRITMPVDTRPSGQGDEIGNLARLCTVAVDPRAAADLTAAVAAQTTQAKDQQGPAVGPVPAAVARARLPAPVKRWLLRLATRSLGRVGCDTSLLSNLGNVADPPRFGPLSPTRLWFSTSAHMPRGLSLGAATVDGRLQLCLRYRNALFDEAAAHDFAAEYAAALSALAAARARR